MILIGLGANLSSDYGGPEETLYAAMDAIGAISSINVIKRSSIWISAPVPVSDQPWYRNAVIVVETDLGVSELMRHLQAIEHDFGRVRVPGQRNAPRVLDLDVLSFDSEVFDMPSLHVPHPRMHERAFVLYPLKEVTPEWIHPVLRRSVDDLIEDLPAGQEIERVQKRAA